MQNRKIASAAFISGVALLAALGAQSLLAQQPGFSRTIVQKGGLSTPVN